MKDEQFMSRKEAVEILINMSIRFHNGVGLGISTGITDKDRDLIKKAVKTMWPYIHGHKMSSSEYFNTHM